MGFLIGLLTVGMVLDCAVLILLVLIQLPKKDAGAGLAFGGGATDALFGSGSGNVLTKITKYAAGVFFVLAIVLALMQKSYHSRRVSTFEDKMSRSGQTAPGPVSLPNPPASSPTAPTNAASAGTVLPMTATNLPPRPTVEEPAHSPAATNIVPLPVPPAPR